MEAAVIDAGPDLPTTAGGTSTPPRYKSHKEVWALRIAKIEPRADGGVVLSFAEDSGFAPMLVESILVRRYMPIAGDFLLFYRDGYRSISPRRAFEEGYGRCA